MKLLSAISTMKNSQKLSRASLKRSRSGSMTAGSMRFQLHAGFRAWTEVSIWDFLMAERLIKVEGRPQQRAKPWWPRTNASWSQISTHFFKHDPWSLKLDSAFTWQLPILVCFFYTHIFQKAFPAPPTSDRATGDLALRGLDSLPHFFQAYI